MKAFVRRKLVSAVSPLSKKKYSWRGVKALGFLLDYSCLTRDMAVDKENL